MPKFLSLSAAALLLIAGPALAAPDDTVATPEKPARAVVFPDFFCHNAPLPPPG